MRNIKNILKDFKDGKITISDAEQEIKSLFPPNKENYVSTDNNNYHQGWKEESTKGDNPNDDDYGGLMTQHFKDKEF